MNKTTATGIVKPLRERVRDLETINKQHQKLNGELQQQISQKDKKIEELMEKINNPLEKMRGDGDL
jgi:TolA-binding protein